MYKSNTIKLYPWFSSISGDLLFFIAIDTLFLSTVRGLMASQIALMTAIGTLVCVALQYPLLRLIKLVGNQNAIRIGTFLLLCSACLYAFGNTPLTFLACIFYYLALFFIEMKVNILKNNLDYTNNSQDYMRIDSRSKLLYSIYTLIIIIISAPLFNINPYIPMYCCIFFALIAFIFSFFIKDVSVNQENTLDQAQSYKLSKPIIIAIIASVLFVPLLIISTTNAKLLTQEMLENAYNLESIVYFVSGLVLAGRLMRVISVFCFGKYCNKLTEKSLLTMTILLLVSILSIICGSILSGILGYIFILIGFGALFGLIDPYQLVIKNFILKNTQGYTAQKALSLNYTAISIGQLLLNFIATIVLLKLPIIYALITFAIFAIIEVVIIVLLLKSIKVNNQKSFT